MGQVVNARRAVSRRQVVIGGLGLAALTACREPLSSPGQQQVRIVQIGILSPDSRDSSFVGPSLAGLADLGYVDGHNVRFEYRFADGQRDRLYPLAQQLVRLSVDVILVAGSAAAQAATLATSTIPVVGVGMISDPAAPGLAGKNLTGLTVQLTDLTGRHLELLLEIVPAISRVGLLWNSAYREQALFHPNGDAELLRLARARRIRVHHLEARASNVLDAVFASALRGRVEGLVVLGDPLTVAHRARIIEFASQQWIPAVYDLQEFAEDGGLMAYGPSLRPLYRRAANYIDKILKGTNPAEIPIERAQSAQLVINARTAQALGLTIPNSLVQQAAQVIQ